MINSSMKREEMQASAVNGSEKLLSAADVYYWEDPDFKANPEDMKFFRASDNIAHDCGADPKARFPESLKKELLSLGAVRPETPKGKGREIAQSNPDNPLGITSRKQGFYVPLRRAVLNVLKDASDAVSVSSNGDAEATETPPTKPVSVPSNVFDITRKPAHLHRNAVLDAVLRSLNDPDCSEAPLPSNVVQLHPTSNAMLYVRAYINAGIPVFPLRSLGKEPIAGSRGFLDATLDLKQAEKWFGDGNPDKYNIGGRMGNGLLCLDVDLKPHKNQIGQIVIDAVSKEIGEQLIPSPIAQQTPSGGRHFLYKLPEGIKLRSPPNAFSEHGKGLDIRADDSYIVLAPSVLGDKDADGKPQVAGKYAFEYFSTGSDWRELLSECMIATVGTGAWLKALIERYPKSDAPSGGLSKFAHASVTHDTASDVLSPVEIDDIAYALNYVDSDDYEEWLTVGMALKRYGEAGFALWQAFSKRSDKFKDGECEYRWNGFHGASGQMSKATIFKLASHAAGYVNPSITRAQNAAQAPIVPDLGIGKAPNHITANSALEHAIALPTILTAWENIEQVGAKAWIKYTQGDISLTNSAKWFARAVLNADSDRVKVYLNEHPNNSQGNPRQLVGSDGKVIWSNATFTTAMHIGGDVLKELGGLSGGYLGLSVDDRTRFEDLVCGVFSTALIGGVWRDLEASSTKHNLRSKIIEALVKIKDKSVNAPKATKKTKAPTPISAAPVAPVVPIVPQSASFNISIRPQHLGGSAVPVVPIAVKPAGFNIAARPVHLGGTAPNPEVRLECDDSLSAGDIVSVPASAQLAPRVPAEAAQPVATDAPVVGVIDDSDEKESATDRLCRLTLATHRRNWVSDPTLDVIYERAPTGIFKRVSTSVVERAIVRVKDSYSVGIKGYGDITSARKLLEKKLPQATWSNAPHLIPFSDCIYDMKNNEKISYADSSLMFNWQLEYGLDRKAKCPVFLKFLGDAVANDEEVIQTIRAMMLCTVTGNYSVQKYVEITGEGSSGKSSLMQIVIALVGVSNHVSTSINVLEGKEFETARLFQKRLVTLADQAQYHGESEILRKVTGGDFLRYEEKKMTAQEDFIFHGMMWITANAPLNLKSQGNSIMRRRVPVSFDRSPTDAEKAKFAAYEGIAPYIIEHELPGVFNWLCAMTLEEARAQLNKPGAATEALNEKIETDNNTALAWLRDNAARCERGEETLVGQIVQPNFSATGDLMGVQPRSYGLYADYYAFCRGAGQVPMNRINFVREVVSVCKRRKVAVEYKKEVRRGRNYNQYILNCVRLRKDTDEVEFFG